MKQSTTIKARVSRLYELVVDNILYSHNDYVFMPPETCHPITSSFDKGLLWTSFQYPVHIAPTPLLPSMIKEIVQSEFSDRCGGDDSVYILTGDIACAFTVHSNGMEYRGALIFPPSHDATSF